MWGLSTRLVHSTISIIIKIGHIQCNLPSRPSPSWGRRRAGTPPRPPRARRSWAARRPRGQSRRWSCSWNNELHTLGHVEWGENSRRKRRVQICFGRISRIEMGICRVTYPYKAHLEKGRYMQTGYIDLSQVSRNISIFFKKKKTLILYMFSLASYLLDPSYKWEFVL